MSEWREVKLSDLLTVSHGWPFKSEHFTSSDVAKSESIPIVVSIGNFDYNGGFDFAGSAVRGYDGEYPAEYVLNATDILLIMTCQTEGGEILGIPARVPADGNVYLHNQRIGRVRIFRQDLLDDDFFYQWARGPIFNRQLFVTASGSKILHTSPSRIGETRIRIPDLDEQRVIAGVLGALDDKIEANRKLAATADELCAAIVRESQDSNRAERLGDVAEIVMGSSPTGKTMNEDGEGVPFYQGVRDFGLRFPIRRVWTTAPTRTAHGGDILVSVRAPVGTVNYAPESLCIGRGLAAVRSRTDQQSTLFHLLRSVRRAWAEYDSGGTVFGSINRDQLHNIEIPAIRPDAVARCEAEVHSVEQRLASALRENESLAVLRDTLLPKLMSGALKVREAQRLVAQAV